MTNENWGLTELPKGWLWTYFESISRELKAGGTPLTKIKEYYDDGNIPFVKIEDIVGSSKYLYGTKTRITEQGLRNSSAWLVPRDSLLYSMYASYGEPIINKIEVATSQAIIAYIPPQGLIVLDYVYYYLKKVRTELTTRGTTQKNLNAQIVKRIPIPLAPFNEQVRIVAKLEELFTSLDAGVEGLRKVKAQLKRYRQAVLKYAFEGKLTEEWRRTHKHETEPASLFLERLISERKKEFSRAKEANLLEVPNSPPLPDGWSWSNLERLSQDIIDCLHSTPSFTETGKYCVDTNCIEQNRIIFDKARFVSEETFRERVRRLVPKAGDVLFAREGTIGTAVVVPENMELCLGQRMMLFRPANEILSAYFMWGLLSPIFESQWKPKVMGTTAPHVNIRDLKQMYLPLTCPEEQRVIVNEIETHTSIIYQAEANVDKSIKQVERLRQSILASAFEGKLVPQDPNDEPAEELLERIREERAKSKGEKDTNRRRENKPRQLELSTYVK